MSLAPGHWIREDFHDSHHLHRRFFHDIVEGRCLDLSEPHRYLPSLPSEAPSEIILQNTIQSMGLALGYLLHGVLYYNSRPIQRHPNHTVGDEEPQPCLGPAPFGHVL